MKHYNCIQLAARYSTVDVVFIHTSCHLQAHVIGPNLYFILSKVVQCSRSSRKV